MIILNDIEKFINEHGSASILRDNIAFVRDQFAALERENAILKQKIVDLTAENEVLKTKIQNLELIIRKYDEDRTKVSEQSKKGLSQTKLGRS
jgi:cell division protein FtsB